MWSLYSLLACMLSQDIELVKWNRTELSPWLLYLPAESPQFAKTVHGNLLNPKNQWWSWPPYFYIPMFLTDRETQCKFIMLESQCWSPPCSCTALALKLLQRWSPEGRATALQVGMLRKTMSLQHQAVPEGPCAPGCQYIYHQH